MAWWNNETEVAEPTMADLRMAAEAEQMGNIYGIAPEGLEKYGDYDWLGGRPTRRYWTEEDQLRINQIEAEQQMYNQDMGVTYSGGPLSNPSYSGPETRWPPSVVMNSDALRADLVNGTTVKTGHGTPTGYATSPLNGMMPVVDPSMFMTKDQAYEQWLSDQEAKANRGYTFDVDGNTEAYSFSGDTLTPEAVQAMRNREGITPVRVENTYNPDPYFQVTGRPVSAEEAPMIRYSPTPVPSGDVPVNNLDNWWKVNTSF